MDFSFPELIGLEYPGRVENADNMLKTLGGLNNISKVVNSEFAAILSSYTQIKTNCLHFHSQICNMDKKRLELNFRPDDVFSKPISGELKPTSGLLLKVTKRRRKMPPSVNSNEPANAGLDSHTPLSPASASADDEEPQVEIAGVVRQMFKFDGLCDFQYLAMAKHPASNKTEFIYDAIMPTSLVSLEWLTYVL